MSPHPVAMHQDLNDPSKALRRLFLTLFLRGRGARGLDPNKAPTTVGRKLMLSLLLYGAMGCLGLMFIHQPVFGFAAYLHAMTFVFVGMFVASSSGEVLFNKEEADILLHRPIAPATLLWAKMRVLVEVSLWLAGAFNLAGLLGGLFAFRHGVRFALAHVASTMLLALFTVGVVVLLYQVCLRRFGRERLDALMTTAQVLVGIGAALAGQLPRLMMDGARLPASLGLKTWWLGFLPPAWFAGLDDAVHGGASPWSWLLAAIAVGVTALVLWLAFGRLADTYGTGLQTLNEHVGSKSSANPSRAWYLRIADLPLLRTWLQDPVTRASFRLTTAYIFRDREVKLRLFPGLAPFLVMPLVSILQEAGKAGGGKGFGFALLVAFLGIIPMTALSILQHSAQWQAADLFRVAPLEGPGRLCDGARRAVLVCLVLPMVLLTATALLAIPATRQHWPLLLPGLLLIPACGRIPGGNGWEPPLSVAVEEAKSASRIGWGVLAMFASMGIAGVALLARHFHVFGWFLLVEGLAAGSLYLGLKRRMAQHRWQSQG